MALPRRAQTWLTALTLLTCQANAGLRLDVGSPEVVADRTAEQFTEVFIVNDGPAIQVASLDFAIQIGDGQGTTPGISSVNLVGGTAFDGNYSGPFLFAGNQPQSQYHVVMKAGSGAGTGPWLPSGRSRLATVGIVTAGAGPGTFVLRFSGTAFGDTDFVPDVADLTLQTRLGTSAENGVLTVKPPSPTAARLAYFKAVSVGNGAVQLAWGTLVENNLLGFRVDRSTAGGSWTRLTAQVIPATSWNGRPQSYGLADAGAGASSDLTYRLVEINLSGRDNVLAVATVTAATLASVERSATGLSLHVRGVPNSTVVVESATAVAGPWNEVTRLPLAGNGAATLALGVEATEGARFYRVFVE